MTCTYPKTAIRKGGIRNPYYKCLDFYVMTKPPQDKLRKGTSKVQEIIHRCNLEPYYKDFILQGLNRNSAPNIDIRQYYGALINMLQATYIDIVNKGIKYSNLNQRDSAILIIKRVLQSIDGFCESEIAKISMMFDLQLSKVAEEYVNC